MSEKIVVVTKEMEHNLSDDLGLNVTNFVSDWILEQINTNGADSLPDQIRFMSPLQLPYLTQCVYVEYVGLLPICLARDWNRKYKKKPYRISEEHLEKLQELIPNAWIGNALLEPQVFLDKFEEIVWEFEKEAYHEYAYDISRFAAPSLKPGAAGVYGLPIGFFIEAENGILNLADFCGAFQVLEANKSNTFPLGFPDNLLWIDAQVISPFSLSYYVEQIQNMIEQEIRENQDPKL